jgi:hypothetical protein
MDDHPVNAITPGKLERLSVTFFCDFQDKRVNGGRAKLVEGRVKDKSVGALHFSPRFLVPFVEITVHVAGRTELCQLEAETVFRRNLWCVFRDCGKIKPVLNVGFV